MRSLIFLNLTNQCGTLSLRLDLLNNMTCREAAQTIVQDMKSSARYLSERAQQFRTDPRYPDKMLILRQEFFDRLANAQWHFLQQMKGNFSIGGNNSADITCRDFYDVYWILMHQLVEYPRPAGLSDGRGHDDDS